MFIKIQTSFCIDHADQSSLFAQEIVKDKSLVSMRAAKTDQTGRVPDSKPTFLLFVMARASYIFLYHISSVPVSMNILEWNINI